jgi:hypothetical protein
MKESDWRYLVDALLFICLGGMTLVGILMGFVVSTGPVSSGSSKYFLGLHRHQWGNIHAYLSIAFVVLTIIHIVLNWKWVKAKTSQIFKRKPAPVLISAVSVPFLVLFVFWLFTPKDAAIYREYGIETPERGRFYGTVPEQSAPIAGDAAVQPGIPTKEEKEVEPEPIYRPVPEEIAPIAGQAAGQPGIPAKKESRVEPEPVAQVESEHRAHSHEEGDHRAVGSLLITGRQTLYDIERVTGISARSIASRMGLPSSAPLNETLGRLRRRYGIEIQAVRDLVERMLKEENRDGFMNLR